MFFIDKFIPLFCVLLSIVESKNIVHPDCDYTQELEPEVNYHIYNPGYPNYYLGKHNCRWSVTSNTRIKLNCAVFNVPSVRFHFIINIIITLIKWVCCI